MVPEAVGEQRITVKRPTKWTGTRLTVTVPAADIAGWMVWRDDFLIQGGGDATEKSLILRLQALDKSPLLELNGSGVGLVSLRRAASSGDAIAAYQVDLYVERWSVGKSASKGT